MSTALFLSDSEPQLEGHLREDGFEIVADAWGRPDVVIADDDGEIERWRGQAPVIVIGREEAPLDDRVRAFRMGCDDYVPRPYHYDELVERIRAVLRRARPAPPETIVVGPLEIDVRTRSVRVNGTRVAVSKKEFALLVRLAAEPKRVFTRAELLADVWSYPAKTRTRTLDSHASKLRRKLRAVDPVTPFIENDWGVGYRLLGELPAQ